MTQTLEYRITWNDVEKRAQERPKIALVVDDEADQRGLISNALSEMDTFFGNESYSNTITTFELGIMAEETVLENAIFVAGTHEAGLHAAMKFAEAGAAPTLLVYDINIMGNSNPMNGLEAALDVVALTGGTAPVVFFTAYDAKDFAGFESAGNGNGVFYLVQKAEGTEILKQVVREAQYYADVVAVLGQVKKEKEVYLALIKREVAEALQSAIKGKDIELIAGDLRVICSKIGMYSTFNADSIYEEMRGALAVVETVEMSSNNHLLTDVITEQSAIDKKIKGVCNGIKDVEVALETQKYGLVQSLVERVVSGAQDDDNFYDLMDPNWGTDGKITVLGRYVLEEVIRRAPGGVNIKEGTYNIGAMSYNMKPIEQVIRGLQMLIVAGERALREAGAKTADQNIQVDVEAYELKGNRLSFSLSFEGNGKTAQAVKREFEAQVGYKELAPKLFRMPYQGTDFVPQIEPTYHGTSTSLIIKVELDQAKLV